MAIEHGLIDLSDRAKFKLSGADRVRYLNGQVSNDVTLCSPEKTIEACVCNVKGKLDGVVSITVSGNKDAFWIDAPAELRETLLARLDRYIIADDCELADFSESMALVHSLQEPDIDLPGACWRKSNRFGPEGNDLWMTTDSLEQILETGGIANPSAIEETRILHGIPKWGSELAHEILPAEAGLDQRAVDFEKGCYLGQEIVSRIRSVGKVNRMLRLLTCIDPETEIEVGWEIFSGDGNTTAGTFTSVLSSPSLGRMIGLAYLKRDFGHSDSKLVTGPSGDKLRIGLEIRNFEPS